MQVAISILEKMLTENVPEVDYAGIYEPRNVDYNIRNNAIRECIEALKKYDDRS